MRTRTRLFNFRVSTKTLALIERRAKQLGISKTALVERGLVMIDPSFSDVLKDKTGGVFRGIIE